MSTRITVIMSILLVILIVCVKRWKEQDPAVLEIDIETEAESEKLCSGMSFEENPQKLIGYVLFNGIQVPYDSGAQCCYITQSMSEKAYSGSITAADKDTEVWLLQDKNLQDKAAAVANAYRFTLYIARGDEYTVCGLIFTGLPVVSLQDDPSQVQDEDLSGASVTIFGSDAEGGAVDADTYKSEYRFSTSGETLSIHLLKDNGSRRKVSLLGMGKNSEWKIYALSAYDESRIRSMLAVKVWNAVNTDIRLEKECRYVMLLHNGSLQGLYILTPHIDESNSALRSGRNKNVTVTRAEDASPGIILKAQNSAEYLLFLQITDAAANIQDDYYQVHFTGGSAYYVTPGRIEYAFGIFPHRMQYMTVNAPTRMIAQDLYSGDIGMDFGTYLSITGERWRQVRSGALSDEAVRAAVEEIEDYLKNCGIFSLLYADSGERTDNDMEQLEQYISERLDRLDYFYGTEALGPDGSAADEADVQNAAEDQNRNGMSGTSDEEMKTDSGADNAIADEKGALSKSGETHVYDSGAAAAPESGKAYVYDSGAAAAPESGEVYAYEGAEAQEAASGNMQEGSGSGNDDEMLQHDPDYIPVYVSVDSAAGAPGQQIRLLVQNGNCYLMLPSYCVETQGVITFDENLYAADWNGKTLSSGESVALHDGSTGDVIRITDIPAGVSWEYPVVVLRSANIATVYIETANGTTDWIDADKEHEEPGTFLCIDESGAVDSSGRISAMRARGHSTYNYGGAGYKHSYQIRLEESTDVLSMGSGQKWVLQSNNHDPLKVRNAAVYDLADAIGADDVPDFAYADVYLNGEYAGNYLIEEKPEVGEGRVEIGGEGTFLFSADYEDESHPVITTGDLHDYNVLYPADPDDTQLQQLTEKISYIETLMDNCTDPKDWNRLQQLIDVDSFVRMFLLDFLSNETDCNLYSTFYSIGADGRLHAGPVWDNDRAWGNDNQGRGIQDGLNAYYDGYPEELFSNEQFRVKVRQIADSTDWGAFLAQDCRQIQARIANSVSMDTLVWGYVSWNECGSTTAEEDLLYTQIAKRAALLKDILQNSSRYCRVRMHVHDLWDLSRTYWAAKGEKMPQEVISAFMDHFITSGLYTSGATPVTADYTVTKDTEIYCAPVYEEDDEPVNGEGEESAYGEDDREGS